MKIIDKNGRLFGKISIIDVLVVVVIAVMAVALYTKNNLKEITGNKTEEQEIVYQLRGWSVPEYMADAIQVGDKLYDSEKTKEGCLGEIVNIERSEGTRMSTLPNGVMDHLPVEDTVNLLVTVKGGGMVEDGHYKLNRTYELGVNSSHVYCTAYSQFYGVVEHIEK